MIASSIEWTNVLVALIAGLPAIVAALYSARSHARIGEVTRQIKTPSGQTLGEVAEYAHDTAIANNMLLSNKNGPTKRAEPGALAVEGRTQPLVPDEQQSDAQGGGEV